MTIRSETLVGRLREYQTSESASQASIAESARVSTRTLAEVTKGWTAKDLSSAKKRAGLGESLTRLAVYLRLDPEAVFRELGLHDDPTVLRARERAVGESVQPTVVEDATLEHVFAREATTPDRHVSMGILAWPPFHEAGTTASFAELFLRMLLGGVSPDWRLATNEHSTIPAAVGGLMRTGGTESDLVFGLYDLPARRLAGLDFIPVPGIAVSFGALRSRGSDLSWRDILSPRRTRPLTLVLSGASGYYFLHGPLGYTRDDIEVYEGGPDELHDGRGIARQLVAMHERSPKRTICFVADAYSVDLALARLQQDGDATFERVTEDRVWMPAYSVGIAVRADAPRFKELLRHSLSDELFGRSVLRTAELYWRLFSADGGLRLFFRPSELQSLGQWHYARFIRALGDIAAADLAEKAPDSGQAEAFDHLWSVMKRLQSPGDSYLPSDQSGRRY